MPGRSTGSNKVSDSTASAYESTARFRRGLRLRGMHDSRRSPGQRCLDRGSSCTRRIDPLPSVADGPPAQAIGGQSTRVTAVVVPVRQAHAEECKPVAVEPVSEIKSIAVGGAAGMSEG